jgi:photosystem II stability/assembly factor-like uncharacterized protein
LAQTPPKTITASLILTSQHGPGLHPGDVVPARQLGRRVFVDSRHGFALANSGEAQYPAATDDGGRTWRISGPALHVNAAQGPLVVSEVGALSRQIYFAAGGGEVVDTTPDGGHHWYRAFFSGGLIGVVPSGNRLIAIVATEAQTPPGTLIYVSTDGGRHWHHEPSL